MQDDSVYLGWTNWETFSVANNISNYLPWYNIARTVSDYEQFKLEVVKYNLSQGNYAADVLTCEGVSLNSSLLDIEELNDHIDDINED